MPKSVNRLRRAGNLVSRRGRSVCSLPLASAVDAEAAQCVSLDSQYAFARADVVSLVDGLLKACDWSFSLSNSWSEESQLPERLVTGHLG